ncbi:MAG: ribosome small subunit-dependent GTPase A [Chloroflexota bacterium]
MPERRVTPNPDVATERPAVGMLEGLVVRTEAGYHRVQAGERVVVSRAPKRLLNKERTATTAVVIGDRVRVRVLEDGTGVVQEVLERANELVRGAAGGSRFLDVIAANLDVLVAVHSLGEPPFNAGRLDRFVLLAEAAEIPALIVLNKSDLEAPQVAACIADTYRTIGYPTILTCAKQGVGLPELRDALAGRISALIGPSGVGKSSLLNAVQPGLRLLTGEISESTGKGRHTTTTAALHPLDNGGYVADTPGLREVGIREVTPDEVGWLFREFRPYLGHCKYSNCTHRSEGGCAVLGALEEGRITRERYESYVRVFDDVNEQNLNRWA